MNQPPTTRRRTTTRYLLGRLPVDERERLEERLLADGDASDEVAAREDELIDAYATGELGGRDRAAFEHLLAGSPRLRERVAFARALRTLAGDEAATAAAAVRAAGAEPRWGWLPVPPPGLRLLAGAAAIVVAVAAGWLLVRGHGLELRIAALQAERQELAADRDSLAGREAALAGELERQRRATQDLEGRLADERQRRTAVEAELASRPARPATTSRPAALAVSFVLAAAVRSAGGSELAIPAAAGRVDLDVDLGGEETYPTFLAVLTGPGGAEEWSQTGLPPAAGGTRVQLHLPAAVLPPGRHELRLFGTAPDAEPELVGAYEFRTVRP